MARAREPMENSGLSRAGRVRPRKNKLNEGLCVAHPRTCDRNTAVGGRDAWRGGGASHARWAGPGWGQILEERAGQGVAERHPQVASVHSIASCKELLFTF